MGFQNNAKRIITIPIQGSAGLNPTSTSKYYSTLGGLSTKTEGIRGECIEYNGIIKAASSIWWCNGANGSAEIINAYIHFSPTREYLFASVGTAEQLRNFRNNNLNIPVAIGDSFSMAFLCPTWVTAPATVYISGLIWIETT